MAETNYRREINRHWGRDDLGPAILAALATAGKNLDVLTIDDLAPADQYHRGGKEMTILLARLAGLVPGMRVLDVGGGLGGPRARWRCNLAVS